MNWFHLGEAVRTGEAVPTREGMPFREEKRGPQSCAILSSGWRYCAHERPADSGCCGPLRVPSHVGRWRRPASYSIAFVSPARGMRATLFDRPEVIDIAKEQVGAAGCGNRIAYIPGDFMVDPMGSGYDLVLLSNIIHSYGPENNRKLVRKCFDALEPGGMMILKDFIPEDDRSGPPFSLLFALHMLIHTGEGDTYTYEEVASWTDSAGFAPGRVVDMTPQSRLWLVEKPRTAR